MSRKNKGDSPENSRPSRPARRSDEIQFSHLRWMAVIDQVGYTIRALISGGVLLGAAYYGFRSVQEMAGRSTDFRSSLDWALGLKVSEYAAYAIAVAMTGAFLKERGARRRLSAQLGPRVADLESIVDATRSSSGMTPEGANPKRDAI